MLTATPTAPHDVAPAAPSARRARMRVVVRPAPLREPPFDDELPDAPIVTTFDRRLPFPSTGERGVPTIRRPRRSSLPEPGAWGRRLLIGLIETAEGRRPLSQLSALLSFSVCHGLGADFEQAAQSGRPHWLHRATVRTVRSTEPAEGVAELSATLQTGRRVRAVAMRLEQQQGRWRCTRLQLG